MDQAEASGKTVEDALNRALAKLGARREEVEFVVLDEGKRGGLFGRGSREAVVRVERITHPEAVSRERGPVDTRIPRGPQRGGRPPAGARGPREAAGGRGAPRGERGRGGRPAGPPGRGGFEAPAPKLTEEDFLRAPRYDEETAAAPAPERGRPRGARGPRPEAPRAEAEPRERRRREEEPPIEPDINAEEVDFAAHIVDDILRLLDINAELTIREPLTPGDGLGMVRAVVDISGEDLGLLIGRRGETLLSLQYIVNLIVSRRYPGKGGVSIDVEHYRHRREEQVVSLAQRMADRVRQTGAPITLEPMTAAERRLVHLALADDPQLMTNSVGEGDNRKVVISTRR
jgi:spoIIIJ-associated protein